MNNAVYDGKAERLPIWRDAQRLLLEIEVAIKAFPHYKNYTLGSDLRPQAMDLCRHLVRAVSSTESDRRARVGALLNQVVDIKITIQLAKELKALNNFATFQRGGGLLSERRTQKTPSAIDLF